MTARSGIVPGASPRDRAVRAAGALAELGATRLALTDAAGRTQVLTARRNDLPGILTKAAPGAVLVCEPLGLTIRITGAGLAWDTQTDAAAARWMDILSRADRPKPQAGPSA